MEPSLYCQKMELHATYDSFRKIYHDISINSSILVQQLSLNQYVAQGLKVFLQADGDFINTKHIRKSWKQFALMVLNNPRSACDEMSMKPRLEIEEELISYYFLTVHIRNCTCISKWSLNYTKQNLVAVKKIFWDRAILKERGIIHFFSLGWWNNISEMTELTDRKL